MELTITVDSAAPVATPTHTASPTHAEDATPIPLPSATPVIEKSMSTDEQEISAVEASRSLKVTSTATAVPTPILKPVTSVAVVAPTVQQSRPLPEPKPYINHQDNVESSGSTPRTLFFYSGVGFILVLFIAVPVALFSIGGVAWWMSKRK